MQKTLFKWSEIFKTTINALAEEKERKCETLVEKDLELDQQNFLVQFTERAKAAPLTTKVKSMRKSNKKSRSSAPLPQSSDSDETDDTEIYLNLPFKTAEELYKFEKNLRRPIFYYSELEQLIQRKQELTTSEDEEIIKSISFMLGKILSDNLHLIFNSKSQKQKKFSSANFPKFIKLFSSLSAKFFADLSIPQSVQNTEILARQVLSSVDHNFLENRLSIKGESPQDRKSNKEQTVDYVFISEDEEMDQLFVGDEAENSTNGHADV